MIFSSLTNIAVLHASHEGHTGIADFLAEHLGSFGVFLDEAVIHALTDTLKLIPFLFLTYLLMEFIEHGAEGKTAGFLRRAGKYGPLLGGAVGIIPQCGFSSVASNLYCTGIITTGTLVAVFLSTSDEMLPLLISNSDIGASKIFFILLYKLFVAVSVGFLTDLVLHLTRQKREDINIDELCDNDNCHCERGIFYSAFHHTVKISLFILLCTFIINTGIFFIGEENISQIMYDKPFISHLIAAILGLIPNCAISVALTEFYTSGFITMGTMLSGLFSGAGVGLLVLFKVNKSIKSNLLIVLVLVITGTLAGLLPDLIGIESIF